MNATVLLGIALLAASATAQQTEPGKVLPPTAPKATVSGTLSTVTPAEVMTITPKPAAPTPTKAARPGFDPTIPQAPVMGTQSVRSATAPAGDLWAPPPTNWTRPAPSPWDAKPPSDPWRTTPAARDPWK